MKKQQQISILDLILEQMPQLQIELNRQNTIAEASARDLYAVWREEKNKVSSKIYNKPKTLSSERLDDLQKQGLIRLVGDKVEITSKGSEIIKTMILGNDKSALEKGGSDISYHTASENIAKRSMKKQNRKAEDNWWDRFSK